MGHVTFSLVLAVGIILQGAPGPAPASAGAVTLLVIKPLPEVEARLRQALVDSQPRVRAAAARVLAVNDDGRLTGALVAALEKESDASAATEMIRTLLLLRGRPALALAERHAGRVGGAAYAGLGVWVARTEPARLVALLPGILRSPAVPLKPMVAAAATATRDAAAGASVLRTWMVHAPATTWGAVLEQAVTSEDDLERLAPVIVEAMDAGEPTLREGTVWALLDAAAHRVRIPGPLAERARTAVSAASGWERFGRELLARHAGSRARTDHSGFLREQKALGRLAAIAPLKILTADEAAVVSARLPDAASGVRQGMPPRRSGPVSASTMTPWLPGLLPETISAAGCRLPAGPVHSIVRTTFRPDGRPRRVDLDPGAVSPACVSVLQALAMTTFADEDRRIVPSHRQAQVLPMTSGYVGCHAARPGPSSLPPMSIDDAFQLRKIRDAQPAFPAEVRKSRIPAAVTAELTISDTGCVTGVRVVQGSGLEAADVAVVAAMARWEYLPVRVDGVAVPVVTAVTITFTFR